MLKRPFIASAVLLSLVSSQSARAANGWWVAHQRDGLTLEARSVEGSAFEELRVRTTSPLPLRTLCDAVWGRGAPADGDFIKRVVIRENDTERLTYEQIRVPVVKNRDVVMRVTLLRTPDTGRCEVDFSTTSDPAYPEDPHFVRLNAIRGHWSLMPSRPREVAITYTVYSEPGGQVPALFARGGQRDAAVKFMKTILERATKSTEPLSPNDRGGGD